MWCLPSLERAGVIQKLAILERKNGLVLSNTRVPVSGTWTIRFPFLSCSLYLRGSKLSHVAFAPLHEACCKGMLRVLCYNTTNNPIAPDGVAAAYLQHNLTATPTCSTSHSTTMLYETKGPFILHRNCVELSHCILLHRNCDVTALQCRMKVNSFWLEILWCDRYIGIWRCNGVNMMLQYNISEIVWFRFLNHPTHISLILISTLKCTFTGFTAKGFYNIEHS